MEKVLRTGISASLELSLTSNTGKNIPYLFNISRLILDKTPLLIGIATDISEQKRMEGQLQQAQKMEAIGTLAGGIAHDFNNILSALVGYTQLAQLATQEEKVHNYLTEISKANLRAKDLVAQILSFSRKKAETATQPLQLKPILKEALKLLRSSIPTSIDIHQDIQSDQYVLADATQIHQVLMNLCTNAYHAMKETGGSISVHLLDRQVTAHDYFPDTHIPPGPYVNLEVIDTGTGMDEKTLNKIFEPYFTTKETGVGTGLGLSIVHGIISQYQGHISVYSRLGEGTSFNIYLPVAQPDTTRKAIEVSSENGDDLHGSERILVIDDDPSILKYYDELLTFYGYSVTTCSTGAQALEILKANIDDVDLVITDLAMPGMTGDKLGAEIRSLRKDLPVIISSGFSAPDSKQEFVAQGFVDFFPKPVDSLLLLNRLRKFLIQT